MIAWFAIYATMSTPPDNPATECYGMLQSGQTMLRVAMAATPDTCVHYEATLENPFS